VTPEQRAAANSVAIPLLRLPELEGLPLPAYMTAGAAGMDLHAAVHAPLTLRSMERAMVPCGFKLAIPAGFEAQIRPRSGLALRCGITVLNAPATIDSDYRGDVRVLLINLGKEPFIIQRGDRIAQMIVCPVARAVLSEVSALPESIRGEGGFGHTG
jgi:dUTP pyrophosphatase